MVYFFITLVIIGLLALVYYSRSRSQNLNDEADKRLFEETDEFYTKKKLFNQSQQPGELDNSVEVIKFQKKGAETND